MRGARLTALVCVLAAIAGDGAARADAADAAEGAEDADPGVLLRAAADAIAGDRPALAIGKLEALGDRGVVDPVVSFDRGLAYAGRVRAGAEQPGDLGRAAHGFEEARELSRDRTVVADATAALAAVRAEVARRRARSGDPIEIEYGVSLSRSIVKLLPENVWALLAAASSLAATVGVFVRARARVLARAGSGPAWARAGSGAAQRAKVAGTTTTAIAGGLLFLLSMILHSARDVRLHVRDAVIIAPSTHLLDDRHVALPGAAPVPEGMRVQLLEDGAEFTRVLAGHVTAWVPSSSVLPIAK